MERKELNKGCMGWIVAVLFILIMPMTVKAEALNIENDIFWHDTDGNPIYSQGGGIFVFEDPNTGKEKYYWYGAQYEEAENYYNNPTGKSSTSQFVNVTCYSSDDLVNWTFENNVLTKAEVDLPRENPDSWWAGRLGVAYVEELDVYSLFIQWRNNNDERGVLLTTCDTPTGDFKWDRLLDMREFGCATINTGDQTVFTDDDGTSYLVFSKSSGRNMIYVSKIGAQDGKVTLTETNRVYSGTGREGNCMFKYNDKYYICASDLYGWNASHAYYMVADAPMGPYSPVDNMTLMPGCSDDFCHGTQTGFFVTVKGTEQETVLFCGDRWSDFADNGLGYNQWCPLSFDGDVPYFNSLSSWSIDSATGEWYVDENNNYAKNGSFDADRVSMTKMAGWTNTISKGNSPIKNSSYSTTGKYGLAITDTVDFACTTSQVLETTPFVELPDGTYDLTAQVRYNDKFNELQLYSTSGGITTGYKLSGSASSWTEVNLENVVVSGGKAEIGFKADGLAGAYCYIDDILFVKTNKAAARGRVSGTIDTDVTGKKAVVSLSSENYMYTYELGMDVAQTPFVLDSIRPGNYAISANAIGYLTQEEPQEIVVTDGGNVNGLLFNLRLNTGSVSGIVLDEGGTPLSEVKVTLKNDVDERYIETDADGKYEIEDINAGEYSLSFIKNAYGTPETLSITIEKGIKTEIPAVTMYINSGSVRGIVTDEEGVPVANAQVDLRDSTTKDATVRLTTVSNANGEYSFDEVTEGVYQILVTTYSGTVSGVLQDIEIGKEEITTANIEMPEEVPIVNGDFEQALSAGWSNDYTYTSYGCYITNRAKEIYQGNGTLSYYHAAAYVGNTYQKVEGLKNGSYVINVIVRGGSQDDDDFYIYAKNAEGEIIATQAIPNGAAYEKIGLQVDVTDETLIFGVYGNLSAGAWGRLDNFQLGCLTSTVDKGDQEPEDTTGIINGLVVDSDSVPLANVQVVIRDKTTKDAAMRYTMTTDNTGAFEFLNLKPGTYQVTALRSTGEIAGVAQTVVVEEKSSAAVNIELPLEVEIVNGDFEQPLTEGWINEYTYSPYGCYITSVAKEIYEGRGSLSYYRVSAYNGHTYQTIQNLSNGTYVINVVVRAGAADSDELYLYVKNSKGDIIAKEDIPKNSVYEVIGLQADIEDGTLTFGIYGNLSSGAWARFDNFRVGILESTKQNDVIDTAAIEKALEDAEMLLKENPDQYTEGSLTALKEAVESATKILDRIGVTQEEVDTALQAIELAISELEEKILDTEAIEGALEEAETILKENTSKYTEASVTTLSEAIEAAKAVLEKSDAAQEEIDAALQALQTAVAGLEKKQVETEVKQPETKQPETEPKNPPSVYPQDDDKTAPVPKKNSKYIVGKLQYQITKSSAKNGTVTVVKATNKKITSIRIPETVKITGYTFNVTQISDNAFYKYNKLKTVAIGNRVKKISKNAFANCKVLKKVMVGSSVTTINKRVFYNCPKLKTIVVKSKKIKSIGKQAFKGTHSKITVKVPKSKMNSYKKMLKGKGLSSKAAFKKI